MQAVAQKGRQKSDQIRSEACPREFNHTLRERNRRVRQQTCKNSKGSEGRKEYPYKWMKIPV